jgi:hypothetical protein
MPEAFSCVVQVQAGPRYFSINTSIDTIGISIGININDLN